MTPDAFVHVPSLRGRITPPERSELRATPAVLAVWDERARSLGRPNWRWTDEALQTSRRDVLGATGGERDLWVYGYGSLMWDPAFHFAEIRLATLAGYRRRFTFRLTIGRGSFEYPGLMLSLETGEGACEGLAFRIDALHADAESTILWRREMIRSGYLPALLPVQTPQGPVTALVFAANAAHPDHIGEQPLDETAACIARGAGVLGTNREYLEQLAAQLQTLAIDEAYVGKLLQQCALLLRPEALGWGGRSCQRGSSE
ncbi:MULTISPECIES: gamma-glutamylcyclotransferase [unclassified Variovorax]|uniref:gamma-glutamylcyclotransferase n=1 Tax=unclassified Variovorax TaxID=663243 RepID=UPI00076CBEA2|nr:MULTISPECIES: gamma-glutamylcyclotransferase [unclassified Variovorax]KWT71339.1 putative cation transport protein ChaC [Variovorax sp. WDL1]PNG56017.1 hypothetical protein CHC07_02431 [Variovorax sp. B4]PNG57441.1 hypothetical protein CHC06_02434 [Variovorax sp. B2]VTV10184.1 putative protein involved in cation transport [Variovorax sp. WDL1]